MEKLNWMRCEWKTGKEYLLPLDRTYFAPALKILSTSLGRTSGVTSNDDARHRVAAGNKQPDIHARSASG